MTVRDAAQKALNGTNLKLTATSGGVLTVQSPSGSPKGAEVDGAIALPEVNVNATAAAGDFAAHATGTATRTDTPLTEVPQTVNVVPQAVLQSENIQTLGDALVNVSNVSVSQGTGQPQYYIRGFAPSSALTNGMPNPINNMDNQPLASVDHVEVLKGPASIMVGQDIAGGLINTIMKTPVDDPMHVAKLSYGTFNDVIASVDLGGPLSADKSLTYRFNIMGSRADENFGGYRTPSQWEIAPVLGWKDDKTSLTVGADVYETRTPLTPYTSAVNGHPLAVNPQVVGNADQSILTNSKRVYYEFSRELGTLLGIDFKVHSRSQYLYTDSVQQLLSPYAIKGTTLSLADYYSASNFSGPATQNDISAKFDTWVLHHTLLAGADYSVYNQNFTSGTSAYYTTNLLSPATNLPLATSASVYPSSYIKITQTGYFIQDQIDVARSLHLLISARESIYDDFAHQYEGIYVDSHTKQSAFLPNYGAVYEFTPWVAAYASYFQSFSATGQPVYGGGVIAPFLRKQEEAGLKFTLLDKRLNVTTAAFDITTTGSAISDALHPGYSIAGGGQISKGFEVDVQGELMPGWNIIASYGHTNTKLVNDGSSSVVAAVPTNTASVWTTYKFNNPTLDGVTIGVGGHGQDTSVGYTSDYKALYLPAYFVADAMIGYKWHDMDFKLSVKNMLDQVYYLSSSSPSYIPLGQRRTVMLTVTAPF